MAALAIIQIRQVAIKLAQAQKMYTHYKKFLAVTKKLKFVSCHYEAGYSAGFINYLEYWKPTYKNLWEEDARAKKSILRKNSSKMSINLQNRKRNF